MPYISPYMIDWRKYLDRFDRTNDIYSENGMPSPERLHGVKGPERAKRSDFWEERERARGRTRAKNVGRQAAVQKARQIAEANEAKFALRQIEQAEKAMMRQAQASQRQVGKTRMIKAGVGQAARAGRALRAAQMAGKWQKGAYVGTQTPAVAANIPGGYYGPYYQPSMGPSRAGAALRSYYGMPAGAGAGAGIGAAGAGLQTVGQAGSQALGQVGGGASALQPASQGLMQGIGGAVGKAIPYIGAALYGLGVGAETTRQKMAEGKKLRKPGIGDFLLNAATLANYPKDTTILPSYGQLAARSAMPFLDITDMFGWNNLSRGAANVFDKYFNPIRWIFG